MHRFPAPCQTVVLIIDSRNLHRLRTLAQRIHLPFQAETAVQEIRIQLRNTDQLQTRCALAMVRVVHLQVVGPRTWPVLVHPRRADVTGCQANHPD